MTTPIAATWRQIVTLEVNSDDSYSVKRMDESDRDVVIMQSQTVNFKSKSKLLLLVQKFQSGGLKPEDVITDNLSHVQ
jgi:hypothetical protein